MKSRLLTLFWGSLAAHAGYSLPAYSQILEGKFMNPQQAMMDALKLSTELQSLIQSDPDAALVKLDELDALIAKMEKSPATAQQAINLKQSAKNFRFMLGKAVPGAASAVSNDEALGFYAATATPGALPNRLSSASSTPLYAGLELSKPIGKLNGDGRFILYAAIDGKSEQRFEFIVPPEHRGDAFLSFPLTPDKSWFSAIDIENGKPPQLGKAQLEFIHWFNSEMLKQPSSASFKFMRLGGYDNTISGTLAIKGTDLSVYRNALLLSEDILAAGNTLPNVGQKDPKLEKRLLAIVAADKRFSGFDVPRLLLLDRSWDRVYGPSNSEITGRAMNVGVVAKDKDARFKFHIVRVSQDIDRPTSDPLNPDELVDSLFKKHDILVGKDQSDPFTLPEHAALAEVDIRKVNAIVPVNIRNNSVSTIRVQSGEARAETFPPGKHGVHYAADGETVFIRDTGGRLLKSVSAQELLETGMTINYP